MPLIGSQTIEKCGTTSRCRNIPPFSSRPFKINFRFNSIPPEGLPVVFYLLKFRCIAYIDLKIDCTRSIIQEYRLEFLAGSRLCLRRERPVIIVISFRSSLQPHLRLYDHTRHKKILYFEDADREKRSRTKVLALKQGLMFMTASIALLSNIKN